ncbi:MAG TPA: GIY-YIG nuclease family protein [Flavilitoribacter sp.]|nr:GIY-YIG nuclease family protein [Flavilitoribacter sp.]HMQ91350.1 GIY-YIG nuclease family protein [Flavilitoribacter sp.]
MEKSYVYILKCADNTFYVGKTNNIIDRLNRHEKGEVKYTSTRLPVELISYTAFLDEYLAARFEKYLKSGSGRAFSKRHYQGPG